MTDNIFCPSCGEKAPVVTKRDKNGMNEDVCICAKCGEWHVVLDAEESDYPGREMTNADRAAYGECALKAGTPDFGQNDRQTDLGDTLSNLLHYARLMKLHWLDAARMANIHFEAEVEEELLASCVPGEKHIPDEDGGEEEETDPENIYGSPSMQQSIEEDRK